jgi:hypothetical protein
MKEFDEGCFVNEPEKEYDSQKPFEEKHVTA